jgi:hypothetical protein
VSVLPHEVDEIRDPEDDAPEGTQRTLGPITLERDGDTWRPVHRCVEPLRSLWICPNYYRCVAAPGHREHAAIVESATSPTGYAVICWWGLLGGEQVAHRIDNVDWDAA